MPIDAALADGDDVVTTELPAIVDVAEIDAGPADDVVRGGSGEDRLTGGPRRDELFGFARDDTFLSTARDGPDAMHGGAGIGDEADYSSRAAQLFLDLDGRPDDGQAGEADLIGTDVEDLAGGSGDDRIRSRDGEIDRVGCGRGRDRVVVDRLDMAFTPRERVVRSGVPILAPIGVEALPEGFALFASALEGREVEVELGCPRDHRRDCAGSARLVRRGRVLASRGFSLRTGQRKRYVMRVPASLARAVRRRGRLEVKLVALSQDALARRIRLTVPFTLYERLPSLP